jgi:flagellar protein FliO/FliZ
MDTLFGEGQSGLVVLFVIVVLGLLALAFWLLRRFGGGRLDGGATRGRQPRLAVIDQAMVDSRRRLVLIRRDNVEHLLIIGGPSDVVVEQNIGRAATAPRETGRARPPAMPRAPVGEEDSMWPLQPELAPPGAPAPRKVRKADPLAELADELSRVPGLASPPRNVARRGCNRRRRPEARAMRRSSQRPTRTSPRWRSGSRPHYAAPPRAATTLARPRGSRLRSNHSGLRRPPLGWTRCCAPRLERTSPARHRERLRL